MTVADSVMIDLHIILIGIVCITGAVALVALAVVLFKVAGAVGKVNRLLDDVSPNVKKSVDQLPETVVHINHALGNVVDMTDDIADTVPKVLNQVNKLTESGTDTVISVATILQSICDLVSGAVDGIQRPLKRVFGVAKAIGKFSSDLSDKANKRIARAKKRRR